MDLAYVDRLAKENNGVKYSPVRQDLFDRTVNAKGMRTKDSQETVETFSKFFNHDCKKESTEKDLCRQGDRNCWSSLKILSCRGDTSLLYYE